MLPKAYDPQDGYKFQILTKYRREPWEHCDYAKDNSERQYLLKEYGMAYGPEFSFQTIMLPAIYWPKA